MPIYEFSCSSCKHDFEELVFKASEIDEVTCPECGTDHVSRKMSAFASTPKSSGGATSSGSSAGCGTGGFS
jgi:putative FmdB family regulatory protein